MGYADEDRIKYRPDDLLELFTEGISKKPDYFPDIGTRVGIICLSIGKGINDYGEYKKT